MVSKAQVTALCAGDEWVQSGANNLLLGPPGDGISHLSSAIGPALVDKGGRVLVARTSDLVQRLQMATRTGARGRDHTACFQDPAMTLAAVDRLVHHSTLFEINAESYRRRTAIVRKQTGAGRPASYATARTLPPLTLATIKLRDRRPRDKQPRASSPSRDTVPSRLSRSLIYIDAPHDKAYRAF